MTIIKKGSAIYHALGKKAKASVSTETGALKDQPYGFNTRFEDEPGTNPEELIAAAHASCFTMALSFALEGEGYKEGKLQTSAAVSLDKDGDGFAVSKSALTLKAQVEGIDGDEFERIAQSAKANCPISKLLNTDITLEYTLNQ
ncbi:MAG: OsmC family peroxiredoxin [Thalassolituus sp.]|jgi:osmotically inducible protein OsmC|uniref:OsmC family protein n=1 Tax=Thalassolituus maritimus TaxID=484498 RepID=A0ABQ0A302_9GAMM|nr:OsmC family protein [Pseudomonadota bacterium]MEC8103688.1 OsmC family protein [Pseudomonadota bacterium]MEC8522881.1 OsmC family protein [Pseudomonadota bacterium]TNC86804.1 MAG: OsmC family peroxiredoxin [Thalassolituus sp.]